MVFFGRFLLHYCTKTSQIISLRAFHENTAVLPWAICLIRGIALNHAKLTLRKTNFVRDHGFKRPKQI